MTEKELKEKQDALDAQIKAAQDATARAKGEAVALRFLQTHNLAQNQANAGLIESWLKKKGLYFTAENLEACYKELKGSLVKAHPEVEPAPAVAAPAEPAPVSEEERNRIELDAKFPLPKTWTEIPYTMRDVRLMSPEAYLRYFHSPQHAIFKARIDEIGRRFAAKQGAKS